MSTSLLYPPTKKKAKLVLEKFKATWLPVQVDSSDSIYLSLEQGIKMERFIRQTWFELRSIRVRCKVSAESFRIINW